MGIHERFPTYRLVYMLNLPISKNGSGPVIFRKWAIAGLYVDMNESLTTANKALYMYLLKNGLKQSIFQTITE